MMTDWKNKKVAVLGAGIEGKETVNYLLKQGAIVAVLDQNENVGEEFRAKNVEVISGEKYLEELDKYDIIVRSPGVKRNLPQLVEAEKKGVQITSHTKIFFELCPAPIIGVTGTKGKGTTSSLIYEMIKAEGLDVYLGGNIGVPPLTFLDKLQPSSWVVLELSSFQLEDLQKSPADAPPSPKATEGHSEAMAGKPHIAVVLMITSDHLDYHEDIMAYVDAKRNILKGQKPEDYAVINRDYPASHESDIHTEARVFQVTREREASGDGCFVRKDMVVVRRDGEEEEMFPVEDIQIPGIHNWENICAAVMAATLAGISKNAITQGVRLFKGLEHRLELVRTVQSVQYYDDSIATNPESALAAIQAFKQPKILILGGVTEGSDFTELGTYISLDPSIKAIIGIGKEWNNIKSKFHPPAGGERLKIIEGCKSMEEIVKAAANIAEPGDVVLLSPACKSFDMFKSYKDRGEQFKAAVQNL